MLCDPVRPRLVSAGLVALLLAVFAVLIHPGAFTGVTADGIQDTYDYIFGAVSLLHGQYVVDWTGTPRVPLYPPGFSFMLLPAVALGGPSGAVWVPYLCAFALGGLAAYVAARLAGPAAAPVAILLAVFVPAVTHLAQLVMSDLPATVLVLLNVAVLTSRRGRLASVLAGGLAGAVVWVRLAAAPLVIAGLVGLTARPSWRSDAAGYLAGAALPLALLAVWQSLTLGSPVATGYAGNVGPAAVSLFFSPEHVFGAVYQRDAEPLSGAARSWLLPNALMYPLQLAGADGFLSLPGVGLVGLIGLLRYARRPGAPGVIGRYGLATLVLTLCTFLPYYWQSARYLMPASTMLAISAAGLLVDMVRAAHRRRASARSSARVAGPPVWSNSRSAVE
jgi:hypothetical protein